MRRKNTNKTKKIKGAAEDMEEAKKTKQTLLGQWEQRPINPESWPKKELKYESVNFVMNLGGL